MEILYAALVSMVVSSVITLLWIKGNDYMKKNHPEYKGEDLIKDEHPKSPIKEIDDYLDKLNIKRETK